MRHAARFSGIGKAELGGLRIFDVAPRVPHCDTGVPHCDTEVPHCDTGMQHCDTGGVAMRHGG